MTAIRLPKQMPRSLSTFERPPFYFSSECVLVRDGVERERMIELWKIAKRPAENSVHAGVFFLQRLNRGVSGLVRK
jgi:hypothetical protein